MCVDFNKKTSGDLLSLSMCTVLTKQVRLCTFTAKCADTYVFLCTLVSQHVPGMILGVVDIEQPA